MGNIAEIFEEIENDMNDFFEYMDSIIEEGAEEPIILSPMTDEEVEDLEMRAELSVGI
tara:strand:- start:750 stop:923 length:174 start_codon:yes stop_codon:yes gene_type:complete